MVSVGGRQPASVEEAVEGIRLGGRTVHLLVGFDFTIRIFNENMQRTQTMIRCRGRKQPRM